MFATHSRVHVFNFVFLLFGVLDNLQSLRSRSLLSNETFTATNIQFNDEGTLLYVTFDEMVDSALAGLNNTFTDCSGFVDFASSALLGASLCGFDTSNENILIIQLSSDASVLPNSDDLTLLGDVFISQETGNSNAAVTLTVSEPNTYPDTTLSVSYSSQS